MSISPLVTREADCRPTEEHELSEEQVKADSPRQSGHLPKDFFCSVERWLRNGVSRTGVPKRGKARRGNEEKELGYSLLLVSRYLCWKANKNGAGTLASDLIQAVQGQVPRGPG